MTHLFSSLLAVIMFTGCVIQGSVIRTPTIDNPCMRDPTSTDTPQNSSLRDQVLVIMTAANTADTKCQQFKDALVNVNGAVLTPSEIEDLNSPLVNVPGIPLGANEPAMTAANNITSLKQDYQDVSIYIRYIEFLRTAQVASDGQFLTEIDAVKSQFYVWLCAIDTILRRQNSPVTEFVDSSVVSSDVKQYASDSTGRYEMNYVLMKNAHEFIGNKNMKLATYFQTLS